MKSKKLRILSVIVAALLLVGAAVGISALAEDNAPTVEIYKKNISYDDAIQIAYALDAKNLQEGQKVQILFGEAEFEIGEATNVKDVAGVSYIKGQTKEENKMVVDNVTYPVIFSNGINAANMTTSVYAIPVVTNESGDIVASGAMLEYSPYEFSLSRFDKNPTEAQKALYKAFLDYGAAVQGVILKTEEAVAAVGGWADAYYRVVLCDAMLGEDGALGKDTGRDSWYVRPGEKVNLDMPATDAKGHAFAGYYENKALASSETAYEYTPEKLGSSYVIAAYKHEFTEKTEAKYLVSTASLTSPAIFKKSCACGEISPASTFEHGTAIPAFSTVERPYYNNPGSYSYFGTKLDYITSPTIVKTSKAAPAVSGGVLTAKLDAWAHFQIVNEAPIEGTKHIVETDIKFSDIVKGTNGNTRFAYISLTANETSGSAGNAFVSFCVNLVTDSNGDPIGVELSTDEGIHKAGYTYTTLDIDKWYNLRFEATEISETATAIEVYVNGVHVSDYDTIKVTNYKSPSNKINGLAIENRGTPDNHGATVSLDNTFIGTYDPNHIHEYVYEIENDNTFAADATTTAPKSYYKSCSCGLISDSEVFYVGLPLFESGKGLYYNDNGNYAGSTISSFKPTIGSWYNPAIQGVISNSIKEYGYDHVFETDVMFDVDALKFTSKSGDCLGWFGLTCCSTNNNEHIFLGFDVNPVLDSDNMVTAVKLQGHNCGKSAVVLESDTWYNIRVEAVANKDDNNSVVKLYVNGYLVGEDLAFGAQSKVTSNTQIYGFKYVARIPSTLESGYTSGTVEFANMFYGTCAPEFVAGQGVYYNGTAVDLTEYVIKKNDYNSGAVTDYANKDKASDNGPNTLSDGTFKATHGNTWAHFYLKAAETTKADTHVFESDIMFAKGSNPGEVNIGWFGFVGTNGGSNSGMFTQFYLNAVTADENGNKVITQVKLAGGNTLNSPTAATFDTDTWYNLRIVAKRNAESGKSLCDVYVNGILVSENFDPTQGSSAVKDGTMYGVGITWRSTVTGFSMSFDNTFIGSITE